MDASCNPSDAAVACGLASVRADTTGTSIASAGGEGLSQTHTVTSLSDSGPGSLRQALLAGQTGDTVNFDPMVFNPLHPAVIELLSDLPVVDQGALTIDGSKAGVILDGDRIQGKSCGLRLASDSNTVRGLQFVGFKGTALCVDGRFNTIGGNRGVGGGPLGQGNRFGDNYFAIDIWADCNVVTGNLIGTDEAGRSATGNAVGVGVGSAGNRIGGATVGERNIVSGNSFRGIFILGERARRNVVAGNYVGTDISGTQSLPNLKGIGLEVRASSNVIGGTTAQDRNLISGNSEQGIVLSDAGSHNAVVGNWIGLDASGTWALPNTCGIFLSGVSFNRIGGTRPGEGNVISGNGNGIGIATYEYTDNLILGNLIGVAPDGSQPLGNGLGIGLHVNTRRHFIGGSSPAEGNVIAANNIGISVSVAGTEYNWIVGNSIGTDITATLPRGNREAGIVIEDYAAHTLIQGNTIAHTTDEGQHGGAGIAVTRSRQNTIRRNRMFGNAGPGILLLDGGNDYLAPPVIATMGQSNVSGTACPGCTLEVYSASDDEGAFYEGATLADAAGSWLLVTGRGLTGPFITATATDILGNTSPFSAPVALNRLWLPLVTEACMAQGD